MHLRTTLVSLLIVNLIFFIIASGCTDDWNGIVKENQIQERTEAIVQTIGNEYPIIDDLIADQSQNITFSKLSQYYNDTLKEPFDIETKYTDAADDLAKEIQTIGPVNETFLENYEVLHENAHKLNHIVTTTNGLVGTTFPEIDFTLENCQNLKELRIILGYTPIVGSYNELYNSSLKLHSEDVNDYRIFYINLFLFGSDVAFTQQKVGYKVAYKSTGELAIAVGLSKTQKIIGPKGYGLLLSQIHWTIRGQIGKKWDDLLNVLRQEGLISF